MQFLKHPLTILSFILFSGLFSLSLYSSWQRNQASSAQVTRLELEVAEMNLEVTALAEVTSSATSSLSLEKIIRDQLLMQKSGESVMQLLMQKSGESVMQLPEITEKMASKVIASPTPQPQAEWLKLLTR